jgi:hypothetical protein
MGYGINSLDYTCDSFNVSNNREWTCSEVGDSTCQSYYFQNEQNLLLGGDRGGKVYVLEQNYNDDGIEIISSFLTGSINPSKNEGIDSKFVYVDFLLNSELKTTASIDFYKDSNSIPYLTKEMDLLPPLGFIAAIQEVTNANPVVVRSFQHGLATGNEVFIYGVVGMVSINGGSYTITVIDANNFSLDGKDSTGLGTYISGGGLYQYAFYRTKVWKRVYAGGVSSDHRLSVSAGGDDDAFTVFAMRPVFTEVGRREIN